MDAALKDRGLTDMAREKIHQQLKQMEVDQIFKNSGIQAAVTSSFVSSNQSTDYTDRLIQDAGKSFLSLEVPDENRSAVYSSNIDSSVERDRQYDERMLRTGESTSEISSFATTNTYNSFSDLKRNAQSEVIPSFS